MKAIFSFLIFLSLQITSNAQLTFEKAYRQLSQVEVAKSVVLDSNGNCIMATGDKYNNNQFTRDFGLVKLNAYGDTLWYTTFTRSYNPMLRVLKKSIDGYYVIGQCDDSTLINTYMLWLCKFDSLGNIQWKRYISDPLLGVHPYSLNFEVLPNTNLFVSRGKANFAIFNSQGGLISSKGYSNYDASIDYFQKGKLMKKDSTYYFFLYKNSIQNNRILRVSENGDTIGSMSFTNDSAKGAEQIVKFIGSDYLITGYRPFVSPSNLFITRIDSIGNMLWSKKVGFLIRTTGTNYYFSSFATLKNGNTVICGLPRSGGNLDALPTNQAFLYCFNDNGDSLWYKNFSPSDSTAKTEFFDVISTSDSGIIACGQILFGNGQQKSYIVKLDSNGDLFNPLSSLEKKRENYFHLYPNPASSYTTLHYMGIEKNVILSIINLQGQIIYTRKLQNSDERVIINTSLLSEGFYICKIISEGKTLTNLKLAIAN